MRPAFKFECLRYAISKLLCASSSVVVFLCFSCITSAWAHDPGLSVATARAVGTELSIHLAMARCDVERLVTLDANRNGQLTDVELKAVLPRLKDLGRRAFVVSCAGRPATLAKATVPRDNQDGFHFQ